MKGIYSFLLLFALMPLNMFSQENKDTTATKNDGVILKIIPQELKIKDKIFVKNKSPYLILQMVVAQVDGEGEYHSIGTSTYLTPNESYTLASFENNSLKHLRGKKIAIKVKGAKVFAGENGTKVFTPYGAVGVKRKEITPELINNLKPSDITYDFDATLYESHHDLYIEIINKGNDGSGIMDF